MEIQRSSWSTPGESLIILMVFNFSYAKQLLTQFHNSVKELNSVVPTKGDMNSQGFVAVGTHTKQQGKREYDTAAYLSVNIDLSPRCLSVTAGKWPDTAHSRTSSTFKKIIQYGQFGDFAMVGHSSKDLTRCNTKDTDILVSIKDQNCGTIAGYHYGQGTSSDAYNEEFGMSLGEYKLGSGKGLVITGRVKQTKLSCTDSFNPTYEDGFIMRLNNNLNLKYFQRFDYDTDVRVNDKTMTLHHFSSFLVPHFFTYFFQSFPLPQISMIAVWQ